MVIAEGGRLAGPAGEPDFSRTRNLRHLRDPRMNIKSCTLPLLPALLLLCGAVPQALNAWRANLDGVGPIRLGMSIEQARQASGLEFVEQPDAGEQVNWSSCHYAWPAADGQLRLDLALVLHQGHVARIEVVAPEIATAVGARVGDTEARLRWLYGARLTVDPDAPASAQPRLLVAAAHGQPLRFIMADGRVQAFHVGQAAQTLPSGGCA
jgi:hypothetical protein